METVRSLILLMLSALFCCALGAGLALVTGCGGGSPAAMMGPSNACKDTCAGWEAAGCAGDDPSGDALAGCLATCDKMNASWRACFKAAETCAAADACK